MIDKLKIILRPFYPVLLPIFNLIHKTFITPKRIKNNKDKDKRLLEIGPGVKRIEGFETLNIIAGLDIDYVLDASKSLPFESNSFDIIYASHVLEHIPWYRLQDVVKEWTRILKPDGRLEIWIPDGEKLCQALLDLNNGIDISACKDGWNPQGLIKDEFSWVNGRMLYGIRDEYPSWHKSVITPRHLIKLMKESGLSEAYIMNSSEVRGYDHGWMNLGICGIKNELSIC